MIELLQAAFLGLVQGLTEFLPISSSGHLLLLRKLLDWELLAGEHLNKVFDVALHAGTFLALVAYFRCDIVRLLRAFGASLRHGIAGVPERRLAWLIVIGTIPAALAGVLGEKVIEDKLGAPALIAGQLVLFALILWAADAWGRRARQLTDANWADGILVGVAQALALSPGVSRAGVTISVGLFLGLTREAAARFSFLLSLPIVGGTALYSLLRLLQHPETVPPGSPGLFAVGLLAAAVSGYLSIRWLLRYLQSRSLLPFVIYRIALGAALLAYVGAGR
jgi:undecaprenyl-diphosphatase